MHMHSILSWVTIPVSSRGSSTLARSWSLEHPSCQASVMFKLPVAQTNQRPLRNYFIYGDGQMVHPITCQVFFRKCLPFSQQFPRTIYQMVIWNKPTGTSGYHSCYVKLKQKNTTTPSAGGGGFHTALLMPDYVQFTLFCVLSGVYTFDPLSFSISLALSKARIFSSLIRSVSAKT